METSVQEEPQEAPRGVEDTGAAAGPEQGGVAEGSDAAEVDKATNPAAEDDGSAAAADGTEDGVAPMETSTDASGDDDQSATEVSSATAPMTAVQDAAPTETVGGKRTAEAMDEGKKAAAVSKRRPGSAAGRATSPAVGRSSSGGSSGKRDRKATPCLDIEVPWVNMIRAPILAKNWVVKSGKGVRVQKGHFPAMLVDASRLGDEYLQKIADECGYDASQHDVVMFFEKDRRTGRCQGEFGAVVKGTWALWTKQASDRCRANDRVLVQSVQKFYKGEMFGWLQCEECQAWRLYPKHEIYFARDAYFSCPLAAMWNPLITGCEAPQEYDDDNDDEPAPPPGSKLGGEAGAKAAGESVADDGEAAA